MGWTVHQGDALDVLRTMPDGFVQCGVTSPPYFGLRDYGVDGQIGLEKRPREFVEKLVVVFREFRRVLRNDGTLWLNMGDSYASGWSCSRRNVVGNGSPSLDERVNRLVDGLKEKDLIGVPWMLAFALRDDGWHLRSDIIWQKTNPKPDAASDRPTSSYEHLFLLTKRHRYFYDVDAIREPGGRNRRDVWAIKTKPYKGAHFAVFPSELVEPCILAGSSPMACPTCNAPLKRSKVAKDDWVPTCKCEGNDGSGRCVVMDPFVGSGTTLLEAVRHGREAVGIELNPNYLPLIHERMASFGQVAVSHDD